MLDGFHSNRIVGIMVLASLVQCTHYNTLHTIFNSFCGFSVPIVMGPVNSGKTASAQSAMASLGLGKSAFYKRIVPRKIVQVSSKSRMPFVIDDEGSVDDKLAEMIALLIILYISDYLTRAHTNYPSPDNPVIDFRW